MTSICWSTGCDPNSLVNVGMDAVAMRIGHTISFIDTKTKQRSYFRSDLSTSLCGVLGLVGHNRFPIFGVIEAVLRPSIQVFKYPDFTKLGSFSGQKTMSYVDARFSEFDHLIAISGYPEHAINIWNIRTGQLIVEQSTYINSEIYCLGCSLNSIPVVFQHSRTINMVYFWALCQAESVFSLYEISSMSLDDNYEKSTRFFISFSEDGNVYLVNDYGIVRSIELNDFVFRKQWSPPDGEVTQPLAHQLYVHKQGLIVANEQFVFFLKKKSKENVAWQTEWTLHLHSKINKIISNLYNEIQGVDRVGNLYVIEATGAVAASSDSYPFRSFVLEFYPLKGIKEETILLLDDTGTVRLIDIFRYNLISMLEIDQGCSMAAHSTNAFVAIGTNDGKIYFISYEKTRAPSILNSVTIESKKIKAIRLTENCGIARDSENGFHILQADFRHQTFSVRSSITCDNIEVVNFFAIDENTYILFLSKKTGQLLICANEMWILKCRKDSKYIQISEFRLPHQYRSVTLAPTGNRDVIDVLGVRLNTNFLDIFTLNQFAELVMNNSVQTQHFGHLNGVSGMRNVITWGVGSIAIHFRTHKKGTKPYMISRFVQINYFPRIQTFVEECFNLKYMLVLHGGTLRCFRLPPLSDNTKENLIVPCAADCVIIPTIVRMQKIHETVEIVEFLAKPAELYAREKIEKDVENLAAIVTDVINFDISVTHRVNDSYRKFCLNNIWLQKVTEQARLLFKLERDTLLMSIEDQRRVRDWLRKLVTSNVSLISTRIRAIFSNTFFENYAIVKAKTDSLSRLYDFYRFYDMDPIDEDNTRPTVDDALEQMQKSSNKRYRNVPNMYEHVLDTRFAVQDKDEITINQMINISLKSKIIMTNALKLEFNKKFIEIYKLKQEIIDNVVNTNAALTKIFSNMNCMLCLLQMETFKPDELTVPVWMHDEVLDRIMTVDDSEIKAINRHKPKVAQTVHKSGRMLLWSVDFWVRALQVMMDGVIEKLWEEEIKKEIPPPEFLSRKQLHEFTLEDQKHLREYEIKLKLLADDRRKYLRILGENERKTLDLKKSYIMKLNEKCTEMAVLKLNYDFALKQEQMRVINIKVLQFKRRNGRNTITKLRETINSLHDYIDTNTKLNTFWEKTVADLKSKIETLQQRDKSLARQLKTHFHNALSQPLINDLIKLSKRRPKMTQKSFASSLVCSEIAAKIVHRANRVDFPLPVECFEFITALNVLDDPQNSPSIEPKHWDVFCKLRRQKIENELKIKATGFEMIEHQYSLNTFMKSATNLKTSLTENTNKLEQATAEYFETVQNHQLQITLTMGQVEINFTGTLDTLRQSLLMNLKDINNVNDLIKVAGAKKLRAMHRVAVFRRKVIYKEWEHKVVCANIDYLKYMIGIIKKIKITKEFLDVLRNWKRIKESKTASRSVGYLERIIAERVAAFQKNLDRILEKIDIIRGKIAEVKRVNQSINKAIDDVKVSVALSTVKRDYIGEERLLREQNERMAKIKAHRRLIDRVRADYAHILELSTILELQRLRTYPTLAPAQPECPEFDFASTM